MSIQPKMMVFDTKHDYKSLLDSIQVGDKVYIDECKMLYVVDSNCNLISTECNDSDCAKEIHELPERYHGDKEALHIEAISILCDILKSLGYHETVDEFNNVTKRYVKED